MSWRHIAALCGLTLALVGGCARKPAPVSTRPSSPASSTAAVDTPVATVETSAATESPATPPVATTDEPSAVEVTTSKPTDEPVAEESAEASAEPAVEKLPRKELLKRARSGVVLITALDALGEKLGFGSGCVVGPGLVLTNYHVIASAVTAEVQPRGEGEELLGEAVVAQGYRVLDEKHDLAVLQVEGLPDGVRVMPVANATQVEQFDEVFAIGHPNGLKFSTSPGFVNGIMKTSDLPEQYQGLMRSQDTEFIQTDAVIAGGSSGGPLLNTQGEIVGINTFRLTDRTALAVGAKHVHELLAKLADQPDSAAFPVPGADVVVTKTVAELQRGYQRELNQFTEDLRRTRGNAAEFQKLMRRNNPGPSCLRVCRDLVQKHPGQHEAADALRLSSEILSANEGRLSAGRHYLDELLRDAASDPQLIPPTLSMILALDRLPYSADLEHFLRTVMAGDHPPGVQAAAGIVLITAMNTATKDRLEADAAELTQSIYDRFGEETYQGSTVKESLQAHVDRQQFAIGNIAPEIQGEDEKGEKFRLSDYRGKVVVLDFWADWCPHCRNLYPHEREMVERLKDQPFALVGVNGDEPDRAKRAIAAGSVTWRTWLDGPGGPIAEQYQIQGWPTIYVLDKEGRIRFEGLRGAELDAAVNSLLGSATPTDGHDILARAADWKYHPADSAVGAAAWRDAAFDDANWPAGAGPLGFGPLPVATTLDLGEPGRRPTTMLFRKTFDRPAGELPPYLLMQLRYVDGVVISLNGAEIYRDGLPTDADWTTPALTRATAREAIDGVTVMIESGKLQPTQNCLAVEVHLFSSSRAELLWDLSLSPPPDFAALADADDLRKLELCHLLGQIGPELPGCRELLEQWQSSDLIEVSLRAAICAAMNDLPVTLKELSDDDEERSLVLAVMQLNQSAWDTVIRPQLSADQYVQAVRRAKAGAALFDRIPQELQPRLDGIFNTLGLAYYRVGQWDEARAAFQKSVDMRGENPFDAGYLALTLKQLGEMDEAAKERQRFADLSQTDDWKHSAETQTVRQELERAFGKVP